MTITSPRVEIMAVSTPADVSDNAAICLQCRYPLIGLSELRCPECGWTFDAEYLADAPLRRFLLPWERIEDGGIVRRTLKTLWLAWVHPGRYFSNARARYDRRIEGGWKFLLACVAASYSISFVVFVINQTINCMALSLRRGQILRALDTSIQTFFYSLAVEWYFPSVFVLAGSIAALSLAAILPLITSRQRVSSGFSNLIALLSPTIPISGFTFALIMLVATLTRYSAMWVSYAMGVVPPMVMIVILWQCCRRYLLAGRAWSVVIVILALVLGRFSEWIALSLLSPILSFLIPI